jgi:ribonucleoside-diphosphate reductase beta chain
MSVFNAENRTSHTEALAFLDPNGGVTTQRFDTMKYRQFDKLTEKQLSFFWRPEEVDIMKDAKDFRDLTAHEQHIFTSNLKRQILLDSVQGRSPNIAFLPIVSLPELEGFITTWAFSESIHSRSYTHIIRNIYPDPSAVFDEMMDISEIVDCAKDISEHYDNLINLSMYYQLLGEGTHTVNGKTVEVSLYEVKKALWMAIMSVNILEGVRFYVSFACSWAYAELKRMEGNAKIIKLICRDENLHLAATQTLIKLLPTDDPDFAKIASETSDDCRKLFAEAVEQEKAWANYLFKDGSMIGLNYQLLSEYVEWIANKRLTAAGLATLYPQKANPLPWTAKWISGSEVQVAPQETEITQYTIGQTKQDVDENTFKGMDLDL